MANGVVSGKAGKKYANTHSELGICFAEGKFSDLVDYKKLYINYSKISMTLLP